MSNLQITQMLVPASKYYMKCPELMDYEYVTIHNTANRASAMSEVSYMIGNDLYVSFHYAVDDYRAVQGIPVNRIAYHTGDYTGNHKSIGIEICYSIDKGDARYPKAEANAAILAARLLHAKGFGTDRLRIHQDWNGKHCPHRMLDNGGWPTKFKAMVQKELDLLKSAQAGGAGKPKQELVNAPIYRIYEVVKSKRIDSYADKARAESALNRYMKQGKQVYIKEGTYKKLVSVKPKRKTIDELAKEVLAGKWGNGSDRFNKLKAAGYDADAVQQRVNALLK